MNEWYNSYGSNCNRKFIQRQLEIGLDSPEMRRHTNDDRIESYSSTYGKEAEKGQDAYVAVFYT